MSIVKGDGVITIRGSTCTSTVFTDWSVFRIWSAISPTMSRRPATLRAPPHGLEWREFVRVTVPRVRGRMRRSEDAAEADDPERGAALLPMFNRALQVH